MLVILATCNFFFTKWKEQKRKSSQRQLKKRLDRENKKRLKKIFVKQKDIIVSFVHGLFVLFFFGFNRTKKTKKNSGRKEMTKKRPKSIK